MSNELVKEKIVLNQNIGKESTQVLLEGDIIVPDTKPDMSLLLKTEADVFIDKADVSADRINYGGKLNIRALYLAKGSDKSIHSISSSSNIDDYLTFEGVSRDMWVGLKSKITNIDYKMLNDRKIGYRAVIDLEISAEARQGLDVVTDISDLPKTQLKKSSLSVNRTIEKKDDRFIIKDEIPVPPGKPNIRELLQTNIEIANKEVKVSYGKVGVTGELVVSTLYRADDGESIIEFTENEVPFNGSIDVAVAREGMFADVDLTISDRYIQAKPNEDGEDRILDLEASVYASVRLTHTTEIEVLDDAYCINKNLDLKRESVKYPRLICRNKNQCPVKESIQLEAECPPMLQILKVSGEVVLDDVKIIDDKVIAEGIINTDILYIAGSDEYPVYNYHTVIPYKQIIETKNARPNMDAEIDQNIDHIGFNMLSENEVEVRYLLTSNTKVVDNTESGVVTDIVISDIDRAILDQVASITIYVVQKDDSLWKIAKKYNTALDDLLALNELENPELIYPGQKLLIIKRILD